MAEVTPSTYPSSVADTVADGAILVQAIAAEALTSASTIVPSAIIVEVTVPVSAKVTAVPSILVLTIAAAVFISAFKIVSLAISVETIAPVRASLE
jgi:hypothetical protein